MSKTSIKRSEVTLSPVTGCSKTNYSNSLKVKRLPLKIVGGKFRKRAFYASAIQKIAKDTNIIQYREVFAGTASVGFELMSRPDSIPMVWFNDLDPGIANFWYVVKNLSNHLKDYIQQEPISKEKFVGFYDSIKNMKSIPFDDFDRVDYALKKMIIQNLSFSGYGLMGGKPIKNLKQRWPAKNLCESIDKYSVIMSNHIVQISNLDFEHVIRDETFPAVLYVDPVYYEKGNDLYQFSMSDEDHIRLSRLLFHSRNPWLLSYDDSPFIRKLYSWASIKIFDYGVYSNRVHKPGQKELLITKKGLRLQL